MPLVERADKLLATAGRQDRPPRLVALQNELSLTERLEDIHGDPNPAEEEFFWGRTQDGRFAQTFREFGIDVEALPPEEVAARIGATSIPQALVQALDRWAAMRKRARQDADSLWKKLIAIAQRADADAWRNQLREAVLRRDRVAMERLAESVPLREVPPATAYLLENALEDLGDPDKSMAVLREAHRHHPDDFWLNDGLAALSTLCTPPRWAEAVRYYQAAVTLRPRSWRMHFCLANALDEMGAHDEASAEWAKSGEVGSENAEFYSTRGGLFVGVRKYDKALADLNKAIELDPKLAAAWTYRGAANNNLRQHDKALADFNKAIELDPKKATAWLWRGWVYYQLFQYDKAVADYSQAIELDPKNASAWSKRGWAYDQLRQYDKAVADYTKAIALEPKKAVAWTNRGHAYLLLREYEKALADYSNAIELEPKKEVTWINRGGAYVALHQYDKAVADYTKAIALDPKFWLTWVYRGGAYERLRQYDKAVADYTKVIELDPKGAAGWTNRGHAYLRLREYDQALADLNKAVALQPTNLMAQNDLAWLFATCPEAKFRDPKRAVQLAENAVKGAPKEALFRTTLGLARYRAGDWEGAARDLQEALTLSQATRSFDRCVGRSLLFLAMAQQRLGQGPEARQTHDRARAWLQAHRKTIDATPWLADELRRWQTEAEELLKERPEKNRPAAQAPGR
jgi:tetratricopeptide (TPR) repeat protein